MIELGFSLGIQLAHGLNEALTDGDPRGLAAAWSELRSHTRHLEPEHPARMAVAIVGHAMGLDGDADNVLWRESAVLRERLAYLCTEEEYDIAVGLAEPEREVWTHEPVGDGVHHFLACQGGCDPWCLEPYQDWKRVHRAPTAVT
jgi:hypothetical protein